MRMLIVTKGKQHARPWTVHSPAKIYHDTRLSVAQLISCTLVNVSLMQEFPLRRKRNITIEREINNELTRVTFRRLSSRREYDWAKVKFRHTDLHNHLGQTPC